MAETSYIRDQSCFSISFVNLKIFTRLQKTAKSLSANKQKCELNLYYILTPTHKLKSPRLSRLIRFRSKHAVRMQSLFC